MVVVADPGIDGGGDVERMSGEPLEQASPVFHLFDHCGVEPDPCVEQEVAVVYRTQTHPTDSRRIDGVQQRAGCLHRIVGQAECPGEHVGGTAGQRGQRGLGPDQPVGRFVEGAITAQHGDHVDAVVGRTLGQAGGVASTGGGGHLQAVVG